MRFGNGPNEYRDFDRASGHLTSIQTDPGLGAGIQNLAFTYDEVGNVLSRTNANIGKTESFTYDDLSRLSMTQVSGLASVTMAYSAAGRITSKSDVGSYTYTGGCGGGPLAVKNAAGKAYCYDAAGRMTSRGGSAITWFAYDLPKKINQGTASSEFTYGVDRARITQTRKTGSTTNSTITYIGALLEREVAGGTTTWRHYVSARGRVVAQVNRVNTTNTVQYLHRDQQGSVVEVTGATGALVQSLAFDAWGLRRNAANWAALPSPFGGTQPTKRGYTGHEHLDNVELVHMNGRVQDPRIGAFISADPLVQAPYHSPSHNRYSYVWNNPLTLVDPSGFQANPCPVDLCEEIRLPPGECERRNYACRDTGIDFVCGDLSTCWLDRAPVPDTSGSVFGREIPHGNDGGSGTTVNAAAPQGAPLSNFQDGGDPTDVVLYPRQAQQEAIYRLLYHHAERAGLFTLDFQDAKAAAVALHASGLAFVANSLGIEIGVIIDGDTNRIVSIVSDFMPSTVTIPARYGDAVWHNHPLGTYPSWCDIESLAGGGRSWSFVSGTTLTGVNLRELPSTNPAVLRGLRDVVYPLHRYEDGEWSVVQGRH